MNLKTLAQKDTIANISNALGIDNNFVINLLEILNSGKIAQPSKAFKDSISKLNSPKKHHFTYLDLGKKQYFLPGAKIPLDKLKALLAGVNKTLAKTQNDSQKTALEEQVYFLEELSKLSLKGFATGMMFFSKNTEEKEGETAYLMSIKNGVTVGGRIKKNNLATAINNIPYKMIAKNGELMAFETIADSSAASNETTSDKDPSPIPIDPIATQAKQSFILFKDKLLSDLKANTLSQQQQQQLEVISQDFETFNQAILQVSPNDKAAYQNLLDAIHKAAVLILQYKSTGKGDDIINDDNIFSEEEKIAIQGLVKSIQTSLPLVKQQVIPNLKAGTNTPADKKILLELIDNIARFNNNFNHAPTPVQKQLTPFHDTVQKQQKQLQSILQTLENKAAEQLNQMLSPEQRREIMNTAKTEVDQILQDLEAMNLA